MVKFSKAVSARVKAVQRWLTIQPKSYIETGSIVSDASYQGRLAAEKIRPISPEGPSLGYTAEEAALVLQELTLRYSQPPKPSIYTSSQRHANATVRTGKRKLRPSRYLRSGVRPIGQHIPDKELDRLMGRDKQAWDSLMSHGMDPHPRIKELMRRMPMPYTPDEFEKHLMAPWAEWDPDSNKSEFPPHL